VAVCVPFPFLEPVSKVLAGSKVGLGAQVGRKTLLTRASAGRKGERSLRGDIRASERTGERSLRGDACASTRSFRARDSLSHQYTPQRARSLAHRTARRRRRVRSPAPSRRPCSSQSAAATCSPATRSAGPSLASPTS
jgi:hypothetical protein